MNQAFFDQLDREMAALDITLTDTQRGQFLLYYNVLTEWNKVMNLTAITEPSEVITKHFVDSVSLALAAEGLAEKELTVSDLGTGAGFPGIPLKIVFPNLNVMLMDSLEKRVKFLKHVTGELGLTGIDAIHGRAEEIGQDPAHREKYDFCVSRAVANMAVLSEYCLPLVKQGGTFAAYKTESAEEEIAAARGAIARLGGGDARIREFTLPNGDPRKIVLITKTGRTPKAYPRKPGTPKKNPITK